MGMEATSTPKPRIFADGETVGALDTFEPVLVRADRLRPGMVTLDPELNTPVWAIDHRVRATRNSGNVAWFVEDLEGSGYTVAHLYPSTLVPVAAR